MAGEADLIAEAAFPALGIISRDREAVIDETLFARQVQDETKRVLIVDLVSGRPAHGGEDQRRPFVRSGPVEWRSPMALDVIDHVAGEIGFAVCESGTLLIF
jgi:hypothetical protein